MEFSVSNFTKMEFNRILLLIAISLLLMENQLFVLLETMNFGLSF